MMITQHSPAPWKFAKDCGDFDTLAVYDANGRKIVFWGGHYNVPYSEGEANVRLITKAPEQEDIIEELLEELKLVVHRYECQEDIEVSSIQKQIFIDEAKAVIAKAEKLTC